MTPRGRMIMIERISSGRPIAHVAAEMGVARKTADKWWRRWLADGEAGPHDRSRRPPPRPHHTPPPMEKQIIPGRHRRHPGPATMGKNAGEAHHTAHPGPF